MTKNVKQAFAGQGRPLLHTKLVSHAATCAFAFTFQYGYLFFLFTPLPSSSHCFFLLSFLLCVDSSPSSGIDVDEFCPRLDEANMKILKQIGDHADDTGIYSSPRSASADPESDSDNELLPKNAVIPEPDEIDAVDEDPEDLLIEPSKVLTRSAEYRRKHFSNNSSDSSDSDDSITRGLDFKNIPVTATIEPHSSPSASTLLTNIQHTITRNLLDNIMKPSTQSSQSKAFDSDDEISDFEILDKDDLMK
jgi:hypothetical protein